MEDRKQKLLDLLSKNPEKFDTRFSNFIKQIVKKILEEPSFSMELAMSYKWFKKGYIFSAKYPEYLHELAYIISNVDGKFSKNVREIVYNIAKEIIDEKEDTLDVLLKDNTVPFLNKLAKAIYK